MQTTIPPQSWNDALSRIAEQSAQNPSIPATIIVRGARKTGKSTFARTLLNHLLTRFRRVAYLESDPGQTEFTPPGLVSLHVIESSVLGPPFMHQLPALRAHFIGSTTPQNIPSHYLAALTALVEHYRTEVQYPMSDGDSESSEDTRENSIIPLIINTMGWTKGLGLDILRRIEQMTVPTHIVSIINTQADGVDQNVPASSSKSDAEYVEVDALVTPDQYGSRYNAADWRAVSLLSYFRYLPPIYDLSSLLSSWSEVSIPQSNAAPVFDSKQIDAIASAFATPLLAIAPYSVSVRPAIDQIILIGSSADDVVPSEVGRVLNGAVVALVSCDPGSIDTTDHRNNDNDIPYRKGMPPPDPQTSHCIGLALIRGVSPSLLLDSRAEPSTTADTTLQLLTPVSPDVLSSVSSMCLVKGDLEIPVGGMVDLRGGEGDTTTVGSELDNIPYLQYSKSEAAGAQRRRVRRNVMRRSQM